LSSETVVIGVNNWIMFYRPLNPEMAIYLKHPDDTNNSYQVLDVAISPDGKFLAGLFKTSTNHIVAVWKIIQSSE
jgi:hypothetical protein